MNIRLRRIYFIFMIAVFLIITPVLLFYASGWRYDTETKSLEKVGAITIETEPDGASVFLDEKLLNKKTPLDLNSLLPGQYRLTITKEGYFDWSKTIQVESTKLIRIPPIHLLKLQPNIQPLLDNSFTIIKQSPDKAKIATFRNNLIEIINLKSGEVLFNSIVNNKINDFLWSANSKKIIAQSETNSFLLIDLSSLKDITDLYELFNLKIVRAQWSRLENDVVYASTTEELYRLNVFQKTKTSLLNNNSIIYVTNDVFFNQSANKLKILNNLGEELNSINVNASSQIEFLPSLNNFIFFLDTTSQTFYYYDLRNNTIQQLKDKVRNALTDDEQKMIFLFNDHEIWIWDWQNQQKELIIRTSEKIVDVQWPKDGHYAFYSQRNNSLKIIEKQSPQRNIYELSLNNVDRLLAGQDGELIYAIANGQIYQFTF